MDFSKQLLNWYHVHQRELPWRQNKDPYRVWLSEVMLQQTRVAQAIDYFESFTRAYPTVADLAHAPEEAILKLWQGLGYYSRARNMHATAKQVTDKFNGVFPQTTEELMKLKGIGPYTARAVSSICFDSPVAVVDGNVYRVLARYTGGDLPIDSSQGVRHFAELAQRFLIQTDPGTYNQAIMEFGATVCTPKNTLCAQCPVQAGCVAYATGTVAELPKKSPKKPPQPLWIHYLVPVDPLGNTLLTQRKGLGIWEGLYTFFAIEQQSEGMDQKRIEAEVPLIWPGQTGAVSLLNTEPVVHRLSHRLIRAHFWRVAVKNSLPGGYTPTEAEKLPMPVLMAEWFGAQKNPYFWDSNYTP
ncbi:MAG TPA: A/G-specific adenine glycosylase [Flavobacteriaceae bacterium]|jgi:A/G-specific adenine glycosylase|nr:A/G-specific adenine glycosylase [Flavobacteriaceae bacterium]